MCAWMAASRMWRGGSPSGMVRARRADGQGGVLQCPRRLLRLPAAEDRLPGNQQFGAGLDDERDGREIDAAVDFDRSAIAGRIEHRPHRADLLHAAGDEALAAEARV